MQRAGVRGHFTIHRYCPCQRELDLQIALKPLCFRIAFYAQLFFNFQFVI
jgi:hypothetical protein